MPSGVLERDIQRRRIKASTSLVGIAPARFLEQADSVVEVGRVTRGDGIDVVEADGVVTRVMPAADEHRRVGNADSAGIQSLSDLGSIENPCQSAGVRSANGSRT